MSIGKQTKKRKTSKSVPLVGHIFSSPKIKIYIAKGKFDFYRADLELYGIDHSGPSYEGRVFLNNTEADQNTPMDKKNGYAGSYHIFGHGGCFGDLGHCDVRPRRPYDHRAQHPLTPAFKSIVITDVFNRIIKTTNEIVVTIVPIISVGGRMSDMKNIVRCERFRINTFENISKK
jgi:hypothetical protein